MSELTAALGTPATVDKLRDAAKQMGARSIQDGSWFRRLIASHVKKHSEKVAKNHFERIYPNVSVEDRAQMEIRKVCTKAAAAGALGSVGASTGELLSLFTEGLGAPIGIPAMVLSMFLEGAYTTLLQIDLTCDLGLIYGIPFNPDDFGEIAVLFGLALGIDVYSKADHEEDEADAPRGLTSRLLRLEEGEIATRIGRKLLEDAFVRNVVPVLGVPISARWNFVGTGKLGAVGDPSLLVEGAWLLCTVDGEAGHEEMLALAAIMDLLTPAQRDAIASDRAFGDDEEQWFHELAGVPRELHEPLLDTLYLIASADRELAVPERRFLRRIGRTLGRDIDFPRIEQICRHLQHGEQPPAGVGEGG